MNIDEYLQRYEAFHREFGIDTSPEAKANKCVEELAEFFYEVAIGREENADDEAIDLMNAAISNVVARGIKNPLFAGAKKLERTAAKYRNKKGNRHDQN